MKLTITLPQQATQGVLRRIAGDLRSAMADAMNTSVKQAEVDVVSEMRRVFDRPTPWALGGITSDKATASNLEALVRVRGKSGSAIPAEAFLRAQIEGGDRRFKRFEVALFKVGAMPAGFLAVPGPGARIDAYGNMSSGQIVQLLAYFQAFPESGYRANTSAAKRARLANGTKRSRGVEYFAVGDGRTGLRPGIYERADFGVLGRGVRAVIFFVRRASYQKRLRFLEVSRDTVDRQLPTQFDRAMRSTFGPGGRLG